MPRTAASKLFLAAYAPLAVLLFARVVGALALLPLEAAKAQAQRAVLSRYAEGLTAKTLDEIARGPVVTRLGLSADDSCCTRDEFTLLTLVLQGKVAGVVTESKSGRQAILAKRVVDCTGAWVVRE